MSEPATFTSESAFRPTRVRHLIVALAMAMSVLLYLDRFCVSFAADYIREDLALTQTHMSWFLSVFFWSYALAQVPSGWLSDRHGARLMLTIYVVAWSLFTAQVGIVSGFAMLLVARLGCGLGQAGAYPTAGGVVSRWVPLSRRGAASAWVALGGRIGGAIAPLLTAILIIRFVPLGTPVEFNELDLLETQRLCSRLEPVSEETRDITRSLVLSEVQGEKPFREDAANSTLLRLRLRCWMFFSSDRISKLVDEHWRRELPVEQIAGAVTNALAKKLTQLSGSAAGRVKAILTERLTEATRHEIVVIGEEFKANELLELIAQHRTAWGLKTEANDVPPKPKLSTNGTSQLVNSLNALLAQARLYDADAFDKSSLPSEGIGYAQRLKAGEVLSPDELRRFNRLLIEAAFPGEIRKLYGRGWRPVMIVYGLVGILVAGAIWWIFRERPEQHPWVNNSERELIDAERSQGATKTGRAGRLSIWPLLTNLSLWSNCASQFGTNVGWLFLVTWLSRYFIDVHNVPILERGVLVMIPSLAGIAGMFLGGRLTDWLLPRVGLKWSRRLPPTATRFLAAIGYGLCLLFASLPSDSPLNSPWAFTAAFSLVYFSVDLGTASVWAYAQDAGGKHVGSILGWGNMWGNLGAAIAPPLIYNRILGETPTLHDWNSLFWVGLIAFALSGCCAWALDATKPVFPDEGPNAD